MEYVIVLWDSLLAPLSRLLLGISFGLLLATVLEALRWTKYFAVVAAPLTRKARMSDVSAAAFSLAFVSSMSANTLLSQSYEQGEISKCEVFLSNIFNSLPTILTHTPTIFFLLWPVLGFPTVIYVGLTLLAALLRTTLIIAVGAFFLPLLRITPCQSSSVSTQSKTLAHMKEQPFSWQKTAQKAWKMFQRRMKKILYFTIPIYIFMYILQQQGFFENLEHWMSLHIAWLSFLEPEALGIIVLYMVAELGAALSAAGFALHDGLLSEKSIVLALLVGNILSTPMRGIRHQLPAYAGFYAPRLALQLVLSNQGLRAISMLLVTVVYYYLTQ